MRAETLRARSAATVLATLALLVSAAPAQAHAVGISRGEYRLEGSQVGADLVFSRTELIVAVPELDGDRDRSLSAAEVAAARPALEETIVRGLEVRTAAGPCSASLVEASLAEQDGLLLRAAYRCPSEPEAVTFDLKFLGLLSLGHRHIASARASSAAEPVSAVLYEGASELRLAAAPSKAGALTVALPLFRLGIQHILTGYDHLVFLLGLILVGGRVRSLLVVITAFTVAHSITLGLAALGVVAPSPRIVEPAIALSIAYVGIENWFVKDATRRWLITFPFGLVHGFGFAGALREIALPKAEVPLALVSFNAGVEAGQLAVLLVVLPVLAWLRGREWLSPVSVKVTSAVIAAAGLVWFVSRATA